MSPVSKSMRILLTNDDGYFSEGINSLYRELSKKHTVFMIAPDREQSASSHSLTLNRPLRMHKIDGDRWITDGTPTDCVMLGIHAHMKNKPPDMIISGINHGPNMGDDVTYSGTVAAAIEGTLLGIPSLAVSLSKPSTASFRKAARFISRLISVYDSLEIEKNSFLNINFPPGGNGGYRKYAFTRQGIRKYNDVIHSRVDPRGIPYYWIGGRPKWEKAKGSDFAAVSRGIVSITPMKLDFTDEIVRKRLDAAKIRI